MSDDGTTIANYVEALAASLERIKVLEAALRDLLDGAEQQSQSHVDVAVKVHAALADD